MAINIENIKKIAEQQLHPEWQQPIPLDNKQLPLFDTSIFPSWLKEYVDAVAEETQTSKDAAAITAIGMLSTAISKKFEVQVLGQWKEPLNTYTVVSLPPSSRKSAVFNLLLDPIYEFEQEEARRMQPIIQEELGKSKRLELRIKKLEEKFQKIISQDEIKPDDKKKLDKIEKEMDELAKERKPIPQKIRLFASDVTPERLAELLQNHGEKISVVSAEGGEVFKMMSGQYSKMVNIDLYLKGWSADSTIIDRRNNPDGVMLRKPAISLMLMVQPSIIQEQPKEFFDRGFPQRVIFSLPKAFNGYRNIRPQLISDSTKTIYKNNVTDLLKMKLPKQENESDPNGENVLTYSDIITLKFDSEADEYLRKVQTEIEHMQRNKDLDIAFNEWVGKLVGQIIRIAGLIHVSKYTHLPIQDVPIFIEKDTIMKADSLRDYMLQHAEAAFGIVGENESFEDVKYLIDKLKKDYKDQQELNYRDLQQRVRRRFKSADNLKSVLSLLEEMNYIRNEFQGKKHVIHINPMIHSQTSTDEHTKEYIEYERVQACTHDEQREINVLEEMSTMSTLFEEKINEDNSILL